MAATAEITYRQDFKKAGSVEDGFFLNEREVDTLRKIVKSQIKPESFVPSWLELGIDGGCPECRLKVVKKQNGKIGAFALVNRTEPGNLSILFLGSTALGVNCGQKSALLYLLEQQAVEESKSVGFGNAFIGITDEALGDGISGGLLRGRLRKTGYQLDGETGLWQREMMVDDALT